MYAHKNGLDFMLFTVKITTFLKIILKYITHNFVRARFRYFRTKFYSWRNDHFVRYIIEATFEKGRSFQIVSIKIINL